LLTGLAWYAGGMQAGFTVAATGSVLASVVLTFVWVFQGR